MDVWTAISNLVKTSWVIVIFGDDGAVAGSVSSGHVTAWRSPSGSPRSPALLTVGHNGVHRLVWPHREYQTRLMHGGQTHSVIDPAAPRQIVANSPLDIHAALIKGRVSS